MKRGLVRSLGLVVLAFSFPSAALAQTTTVHVEVDVHVETPPDVIVVHAPPTEPSIAERDLDPPIALVLLARGELFLSDEYGMAGLGGAAGIGGALDGGWGGALVVGYLGDFGAARSEVHLGIEITKDFDPTEILGFYVLFGVGAAFVGDDPDDPHDAPGGERLMGQLGVGARMNVIDPRVALTLDARGVLRYALPDVHDFHDRGSVSGGAMLTMGLAIQLD